MLDLGLRTQLDHWFGFKFWNSSSFGYCGAIFLLRKAWKCLQLWRKVLSMRSWSLAAKSWRSPTRSCQQGFRGNMSRLTCSKPMRQLSIGAIKCEWWVTSHYCSRHAQLQSLEKRHETVEGNKVLEGIQETERKSSRKKHRCSMRKVLHQKWQFVFHVVGCSTWWFSCPVWSVWAQHTYVMHSPGPDVCIRAG